MVRSFAAILVLLLAAPSKRAWGCNAFPQSTLQQEAAHADFVLLAKVDPATCKKNLIAEGLVVRTIVDNCGIAFPARLSLDRPITDPAMIGEVLLFGMNGKNGIEFYRIERAPKSVVNYLDDVLTIPAEDAVGRLRFCFDHLDNSEQLIANDAMMTFRNATLAHFQLAAAGLPTETLCDRIRERSTPFHLMTLYCRLLGESGTKADAALLLEVARRYEMSHSTSLMDEVLIAATLLDPVEGWKTTREFARTGTFSTRYLALKAVRHFHGERIGVVAESQVLAAHAGFLNQPDMADFAIEDLRQWKRWESADGVLRLAADPEFQRRIVQGAILRFALQCPGEAAARHVKAMEDANPDKVAAAREKLLEE